jgi:hypothetical protein
MSRFFLSLFSILLFINHLNAQSEAVPTGRLAVQDLSPAEAKLHQETIEVEGFARKLSALKTAFAEKDQGRIVAYEAHILRGLRNETDQMIAKASATAGQASQENTRIKISLEKMTSIMADFEGHSFSTAQPDLAARDFAKLDAFLSIMQEELATTK